jgi:predicted phosphodiesterase
MITPDTRAAVEAVRAHMKLNGVSRRAAAAELGFSESNIRLWEKELDDAHPTADSSYSDGLIEIPTIHRDYSRERAHYVYPLGDVHKGSPAYDAEKWNEWLAYLKGESNCSLLGTGDFLNAALKTSVSEVYDETYSVGEAKRELRAELKPLASRIDLLIPGNHEDRIYKAVGDCPIEDIADSLECPYARKVALVVYQVGSVEYLVYVRHGTGAGGVGARANRLEKQAQTLHADVYISGHTHSQLIFPQEIFMYDPAQQKVVRKRRYFVSSGSFLRYEDYAAGAGMTPTKMGAPRIRLDGERFDIHVSI